MGIVEVYNAFIELPVERGRYEWLRCSIRGDHSEMIRAVEEDGCGDIRAKYERV